MVSAITTTTNKNGSSFIDEKNSGMVIPHTTTKLTTKYFNRFNNTNRERLRMPTTKLPMDKRDSRLSM